MENELGEKVLEMRMYFFTIYQLMGIQSGIQCGHAALRYARLYSAEHPEVWDFVDNHETWIILNGGTTNSERDFEEIPLGSINLIADQLQENDVMFSYFIEPDLNNALTSLCFLLDEKVFNKKDYPDFVDYLFNIKMYKSAKDATPTENIEVLKEQTNEHLQELFPEYYKEWVRFLGGVKNVFLRELIKGKKLA